MLIYFQIAGSAEDVVSHFKLALMPWDHRGLIEILLEVLEVVLPTAEVIIVHLAEVALCRALPLLRGKPDIKCDTIILLQHWYGSALWRKKSR